MDQTIGVSLNGVTPQKVVPLLQALNRAEELTSAIALRLDPITNHALAAPNNVPANTPMTVTGRINTLGDTLQYLLDNIEL